MVRIDANSTHHPIWNLRMICDAIWNLQSTNLPTLTQVFGDCNLATALVNCIQTQARYKLSKYSVSKGVRDVQRFVGLNRFVLPKNYFWFAASPLHSFSWWLIMILRLGGREKVYSVMSQQFYWHLKTDIALYISHAHLRAFEITQDRYSPIWRVGNQTFNP